MPDPFVPVDAAIIALLAWGGDVIRGFSWALFVGFLTGCYSSIFIASATIVEYVNFKKRRQAQHEQQPPKGAAPAA